MRLCGSVFFFIAFGLFTSISFAAEYYRYTDEQGITVINSQGVPSDVIGQGYEVLNEQGRVIRVVPRAPTAEEYRQMQADKAQAQFDRQLLRVYPRLEDVEYARERKVSEIETQLYIARNNMLMVKDLQLDLQRQLDGQAQAEQVVANTLRERLAEARVDQQRLEQQIARYLQTQHELELTFARDKKRLMQLLKTE